MSEDFKILKASAHTDNCRQNPTLAKLSDAQVKDKLIGLKGIGPWIQSRWNIDISLRDLAWKDPKA